MARAKQQARRRAATAPAPRRGVLARPRLACFHLFIVYRLIAVFGGLGGCTENTAPPQASQPATVAAACETCTPTQVTQSASFNATPIAAGRTLWFTSALTVSGLSNHLAHVSFKNQRLRFTAGGTTYDLPVPDGYVTFEPAVSTATTEFDAAEGVWKTVVPASSTGRTFAAARSFVVPAALPADLTPVSWTGSWESDVTGLTVSWQWGAATYTQFSADYSALGVKPVEESAPGLLKKFDPTGTPDAYKSYAIAGARGTSATSYVGTLTSATSVSPAVCTRCAGVVCAASDPCHSAGKCSTFTGTCSNPAKANGSACNDGNPCTRTDTCQSGTCVGGDPVLCTASDQCHAAGTCDAATGACSDPRQPDGTACNDGSACTSGDVCAQGTCRGTYTCASGRDCVDLGVAGDYALFVLGEATALNADVEGRAAVGGAATFTSFSIGQRVPPSSRPVLVVGGNLTFHDGTVYGRALYGATADLLRATGNFEHGTAIDFVAAAERLRAESSRLAALPANGTTGLGASGARFAGTDPGRNVFAVTAAELGRASGISLQVPAGSSVVVNVSGTSATLQYQGMNLNGHAPERVLFNFSQAHSVALLGIGFEGSVLAPAAELSLHNGAIHGSAVAASFTSTGQLNLPSLATCSAGDRCTGVTCTASDQCHATGTCDPTTGVCSNPPRPDGSVCNDGNACTRTDTCQSGTCVGANLMTCTASDPCHSGGTCDPATGACSGRPAPDGTACELPHATAVCHLGVCAPQGCQPGFGDCDGRAANGCETDLTADAEHCGACGNACAQGVPCVAGACQQSPGTTVPPPLLGVCSALVEARCTSTSGWSVAQTTTTPHLISPASAPVDFTVTVTEGPTRHSLDARAGVRLSGMSPSGTQVRGVVVSLQKGDGAGGFTTIASTAAGDAALRCECPFVQSADLSVVATDGAGALRPAGEALLPLLGFGDSALLLLAARYDLSAGLVRPGDSLRFSTCFTFTPGVSAVPACFLEGGFVRSVQACSPFALSACDVEQETLSLGEAMSAPDPAVAILRGVTLTSASATVTPAGRRTLQPGGDALPYSVRATGTPGTVSTLTAAGTLSCVAGAAGRSTTVRGTTTLLPPTGAAAALEPTVAGLPAAAVVDVACP